MTVDAAQTQSGGAGLLRLHSGPGRIALAATVLASSSALLDSTVANVALPHIGEEFGGDLGGLQWVVTGYLLTLASFILLGGALGDRYGRRRIFRLGAVWFGLASLACALAPSLPLLILARLLQGAGASLLTPTSLALTQSTYVEDDRAAAVGAWSGLGGIAGAIGPLVGGWLVDGPGWRWAFLINLPLIAAALVATRAIPAAAEGSPAAQPEASPAAQVEGTPAGAVAARSSARFDVLGSVLAAVSLGAATWALTQGAERGADLVGTFTALAAALGFGLAAGGAAFGLAVVCALVALRDVVGAFGRAVAFIEDSLLLPRHPRRHGRARAGSGRAKDARAAALHGHAFETIAEKTGPVTRAATTAPAGPQNCRRRRSM